MRCSRSSQNGKSLDNINHLLLDLRNVSTQVGKIGPVGLVLFFQSEPCPFTKAGCIGELSPQQAIVPWGTGCCGGMFQPAFHIPSSRICVTSHFISSPERLGKTSLLRPTKGNHTKILSSTAGVMDRISSGQTVSHFSGIWSRETLPPPPFCF